MVRVKSLLIYMFGGAGSLAVIAFFSSWAIKTSRAQEVPPADPNMQMAPAQAQTAPVEMPMMPGQTAGEAPAPTPGPIELVQQAPAGDFMAPYIFDNREGRRNPFRPMVMKDEGGDRVAIGPATPLERYELDELRLMAIMWDVKNPRAMIMDPNKEIHIVGKDDRLGRRQGYIAVIREGELVVVETADFNGEAVYSTRVVKIEK